MGRGKRTDRIESGLIMARVIDRIGVRECEINLLTIVNTFSY